MNELAGKRERNKVANRAAILEAARKVFHASGFDAVTIRDVIRETHLAAGTFYNYFPDKESLFRALVEERMAAMTERMSYVRRNAQDLHHFVRDAYNTVFTEICAHPDFYQMMFRNEPIVRAFYNDSIFGYTMRTLKIDLADAIARGLLPDMDIDYLTAILFGAGYELARMLAEKPDPSPSEAADFATRLFLNGIQGMQQPEVKLIQRGPLKLEGAAR